MPPEEQDRLTTNIANALRGVTLQATIDRQLAHVAKADPRYGAEVARKLQD